MCALRCVSALQHRVLVNVNHKSVLNADDGVVQSLSGLSVLSTGSSWDGQSA